MIHRSHSVLVVADLDRSAACYREVLGFAIRELGEPVGAERPRPLPGKPQKTRELGLRTVNGHQIMVGQELR